MHIWKTFKVIKRMHLWLFRNTITRHKTYWFKKFLLQLYCLVDLSLLESKKYTIIPYGLHSSLKCQQQGWNTQPALRPLWHNSQWQLQSRCCWRREGHGTSRMRQPHSVVNTAWHLWLHGQVKQETLSDMFRDLCFDVYVRFGRSTDSLTHD